MYGDAGAKAAAASVAAATAAGGAGVSMNDINNDGPPQLDQLTMDPAAVLAVRNLRPATDASRAGTFLTGSSLLDPFSQEQRLSIVPMALTNSVLACYTAK